MADADELIDEAAAARARGEDDSVFLAGRVSQGREAPWSYEQQANALLQSAAVVLDHGTGDGTLLRSLASPDVLLAATEDEEWAITETARTLAGHAELVRTDPETHNSVGPVADAALAARRSQPFRSSAFDLLLARHASFAPTEAFRLLRPGGRLLAQEGMVAERPGNRDIALAALAVRSPWGTWDVRETTVAAGFEIDEYREWLVRTEYYDVGAVAFALLSPRRLAQGLRLEHIRPRLRQLHEQILETGPVATGRTTLLVLATKPG